MHIWVWCKFSTYCTGTVCYNIETDLKSVKSMIHVIQGNHRSLLSYDTACNLGLTHVRMKHVNVCPQACDKLVKNIQPYLKVLVN